MNRGRGGEAMVRKDKRAGLSSLSIVNYEINIAACGSAAQVFCMITTPQVKTGDVAGH